MSDEIQVAIKLKLSECIHEVFVEEDGYVDYERNSGYIMLAWTGRYFFTAGPKAKKKHFLSAASLRVIADRIDEMNKLQKESEDE